MKDRFFGGKFNPDLLQTALNSYADEGWRLVNAVSADIPGGLTGARNEMVMIMERVSWDDSQPMASITISNGVLIVQGTLDAYKLEGTIETNINRQNATLGQLREKMAILAISKGANVITNFTNSQRGSKPLALMNPFKWDTEYLSGFGELALVPKESMAGVMAELAGNDSP